MRILIVEDNKETAEQLTRLLKKAEESLEIEIAHTLADGLRLSNSTYPDVTLLDLTLPDVKDWRETVKAIPLFVPPVIVVTEMDDVEVKVACAKAGCDNLFEKRTVYALTPILVAALVSAKMRRLGRKTMEC